MLRTEALFSAPPCPRLSGGAGLAHGHRLRRRRLGPRLGWPSASPAGRATPGLASAVPSPTTGPARRPPAPRRARLRGLGPEHGVVGCPLGDLDGEASTKAASREGHQTAPHRRVRAGRRRAERPSRALRGFRKGGAPRSGHRPLTGASTASRCRCGGEGCEARSHDRGRQPRSRSASVSRRPMPTPAAGTCRAAGLAEEHGA